MIDIWDINYKVQVSFALFLIIFLLMYIAFWKKPAEELKAKASRKR